MFKRNILADVQTAMTDTPVILIHGPRQSGKSTLVKAVIGKLKSAAYTTLDEQQYYAAASDDPAGFLRGYPGTVSIDEVQRVPELFRAIKLEVDSKRVPGRYILTASANIFLIPSLSESLAGRMELLSLHTLSWGELNGVTEGFVDALFQQKPLPRIKGISRKRVMQMLVTGGYPEAVVRKTAERRKPWFRSYISMILQRDVRDLANIEGLTAMPRLLSITAARSGGMLNFADFSRVTTIPQTTLKRYMTLLETIFLIWPLPAWSGNVGKRLVKTPKLYVPDSGLLAHLLGLDDADALANSMHIGMIFETAVIAEVRKQLSWSKDQYEMYYYRTQTGQEVDCVLEDRKGNIVGIEVKASSYVDKKDFLPLQSMADELKKKFIRGVVIHTGTETVTFSEKMIAMPVNALWEITA